MDTYIYQTSEQSYLKVCEIPHQPHCPNKGIVEGGVLNMKSLLVEQLRARGWTGIYLPLNGPVYHGHGVGFVGYLAFGSDNEAILWLCRYLAHEKDTFSVTR